MTSIPLNQILQGNSLVLLKTLPDNCVDCMVTSPPYFCLRDYKHKDQLGMEKTPEEYVARMVEIFTEARRVLKTTGTLWLNLGDTYASNPKGSFGNSSGVKQKTNAGSIRRQDHLPAGYKAKDLIGIPWMVAFALRSAGWYLRQDIIWNKPNPMPESVTDRCTKAHEYIFLMSKSSKYYYDAEAIKTEMSLSTVERLSQNVAAQNGSDRVPGKTNGNMKAPAHLLRKGYKHRGEGDKKLSGHSGNRDKDGNVIGGGLANKRSVWTVTTMPYSEAHFATFPERLIIDCIKAGCSPDGVVLDMFIGAGTAALVARKLGRNFIGMELNPDYIKIAEKRLQDHMGMFR